MASVAAFSLEWGRFKSAFIKICLFNAMLIIQDDYDINCLGDAGELEKSIDETTITDHNPYDPPLPAHQPRRSKSLKERLAMMLNSNDSHPFNNQAPPDI